jgi:hypothetical protein
MRAMAKVDLLRVFLASPGDVAREREVVKEVLDSVNRTLGVEKDIRFELVGWDTDTYPAYGGDAQSNVNNQIADMIQYDLFVGLMWNRFGTPTPRADSGTEEEFRRAVQSYKGSGRPLIMFYFNQQPFNPSSAKEAEQKMKVLAFKEEMDKDGLTATYEGAENLRQLFQRHIETWLIKNRPTALPPQHAESSSEKPAQVAVVETKTTPTATPEAISNSGMWVFLHTQFIEASEVTEISTRRLSLKIPVKEASEDAALRSLQPSQYGRQELVPFAHQNIGGIVKVIDAKRTSMGNTAIWDLTVELEELRTGFGMELAYGNLSADEIAVMRARYLLLNEKAIRPSTGSQRNVLEDTMLEAFVQGISTRVKVKGSVLPAMWKEFKGETSEFLYVARLWSVFQLISSNTCEYILDLTLGPIKDGVMHVRFRGQRHKEYTNRDPYIIEFEGDCDLRVG